jgi:lantibiotic biosynthesis dehydratase-like protein
VTAVRRSALVRVAGLPIQLWLAAGAPDLFATVRRLEAADTSYRAMAAALAERIGAELVPSDELSAPERGRLLAIRRGLHRGTVLSPEDSRLLDKLAARAAADLGDAPAGAERLAADMLTLRQDAAAAIEAESQRLLRDPWTLLRSSAAGRRVLADQALAAVADIEDRLARGDPWTGKRMRQRSEHLWRMIDRAAVKTTPRGWLGHVALAMIGDEGSAAPALTAEVAAEWTENVHASRAAAATSGDPWLSLAPLQLAEPEDYLRIWALAPDATRLRTVRVRRSAALTAVADELRTGPVRLSEFGHDTFGVPGSRQQATMRAFVSRLADMGVLQFSAVPRQERHPWQVPGQDALAVHGAPGYLDVYRVMAGAPSVQASRLQRAMEQVQRLRWLMQADVPPATARPADGIGPVPLPVLEVFAAELAAWQAGAKVLAEHQHHGWPRAHTAGSGYARLLGALAAKVDTAHPGAETAVDITEAMLDRAGAPGRCLRWPVDVTIRTLGPGLCVLDNTTAAGMLDARHIEMLEWLHGPVPHATAYREFIAELDRLSGIRSVELLVPPLSEPAANAVRRPPYTSAWTGDSDPGIYGASWHASAEYIPLAALTIHKSGDRVVVAAYGQPLRILYHATRTVRGPWKLLAGLMLRDSPQHPLPSCSLRAGLGAFTGRDFLPRITVGGSLVVSAAQWRIGADELWARDADQLTKTRGLIRLRERRGLPRWIFVSTQLGAPPLPCDLESLRALRLMEQMTAAGPPGLIAEEMIPAPPLVATTDQDGRVATELMLRLPASMSSLAADLARSERADTSQITNGGGR